ncbi:MAG: type I-MYXAN CRISPR-associated protein Cas6/Cmx6 [Candidatus Electrothrix sp.]
MIDLHFQVQGETIQVDHGYALFSAISSCLGKEFHHEKRADVRLALIRGRYAGDGLLKLLPSSRITLRLPLEKVALYINLAGKTLDLVGHKVRVGVPKSQRVMPATVLYAHLVTTKSGLERKRFEKEIRRQLDEQGCHGRVFVGKRRTFSIHGKKIVGYSLLVSELSAEESLVLQEKGVGGRGRMGCGFFYPWTG